MPGREPVWDPGSVSYQDIKKLLLGVPGTFQQLQQLSSSFQGIPKPELTELTWLAAIHVCDPDALALLLPHWKRFSAEGSYWPRIRDPENSFVSYLNILLPHALVLRARQMPGAVAVMKMVMSSDPASLTRTYRQPRGHTPWVTPIKFALQHRVANLELYSVMAAPDMPETLVTKCGEGPRSPIEEVERLLEGGGGRTSSSPVFDEQLGELLKLLQERQAAQVVFEKEREVRKGSFVAKIEEGFGAILVACRKQSDAVSALAEVDRIRASYASSSLEFGGVDGDLWRGCDQNYLPAFHQGWFLKLVQEAVWEAAACAGSVEILRGLLDRLPGSLSTLPGFSAWWGLDDPIEGRGRLIDEVLRQNRTQV